MQFREIFLVHSKNRIKFAGAVRGEMLGLLLWQTSTAEFLTIGGREMSECEGWVRAVWCGAQWISFLQIISD